MDKFVTDQAEGLRRLLARRPLRVVTMLSARSGAGASTAAINLAAGLCHLGKRAVVIDEHAINEYAMPEGAIPVPADQETLSAVINGDTTLATQTSAVARPKTLTLAEVVSGEATLEGTFFSKEGCHDGALLTAPRMPMQGGDAAGGLPAIDSAAQIAALDGQADVVLIDACLNDSGLSPLAASAHDIIIVMEADATSLTSAYGLVKRLHFAHASQQFRLLFNRVAHPADAQGIFHNLSGVAARYLGISLTPAGVISRDRDRILRATKLGSSVVSAFPSAPAAIDYRRIAADMLHWPWRPLASSFDRPSRAERIAERSERASAADRNLMRHGHDAAAHPV